MIRDLAREAAHHAAYALFILFVVVFGIVAYARSLCTPRRSKLTEQEARDFYPELFRRRR